MTEHIKDTDRNGLTQEDVEVEHLLREFFRYEVPCSLQDGLSISEPQIRLAAHSVRLNTATGSAVRQITTTTALAALVVAMFMLSFTGPRQPDDFAGSDNVTSEATVPPDDQLMLVSPDADSTQHAVSEEGLLLEETDQIDLNPKREK